MKFSTKDKSQIMENDRYLLTKKVIIDKLPDTNGLRPKIGLNSPARVEVSAAEVHEVYL